MAVSDKTLFRCICVGCGIIAGIFLSAVAFGQTRDLPAFPMVPESAFRPLPERTVPIAATNVTTGTQAYRRVFDQVTQTGQHRPVLFVHGDREAEQVARFQSLMKAAGHLPPAVVDLDSCDSALRSKFNWMSEGAFLAMLHRETSFSYDYGPTYKPLKDVKAIGDFTTWAARNQSGITKRAWVPQTYQQPVYQYRYYQPMRTFQSWGFGGRACAT